MKTTKEDIYKTYKHGGNLKEFEIDKVYNALKENQLQVVLVYDLNHKEYIYNFIPETKKFHKIY